MWNADARRQGADLQDRVIEDSLSAPPVDHALAGSMRLASLALLEVVAVIDVAVPGARAVLRAGDRVEGRVMGGATAVA